jgi:hypothetical protein
MDLRGAISIRFNTDRLWSFCGKHIHEFDRERYTIVAVRFFSASEYIVTVYAEDKQNTHSLSAGKDIPVRKFKIERFSPLEFLECLDAGNFTVSNNSYNIEDMEVVNR